MAEYTEQEDKELNQELKQLQNRANKLILSDYYDSVKLNEIQYSILTSLTNANSHKDINPLIWNNGLIYKTLDYIYNKIKEVKRKNKKVNK